MFNKKLLVLALACLMLSCRQVTTVITEVIDFSITSPQSGWTYHAGTPIMLAVNVATDEVVWESDIAGYLGEGNHLTIFLAPGMHRISATIKGIKKEHYAHVVSGTAGHNHTVLVHYSPLDIPAGNGNYSSYLYTHEGSINAFYIQPVQHTKPDSIMHYRALSSDLPEIPVRDIRLPMPASGIAVEKAPIRAYNLTLQRTFKVINTRNQLGPLHHLEAELLHQTDTVSVWVSVDYPLPYDALHRSIQAIETFIIPRVQALWGKPADIDGDGRIALLFTHTLNDEQAALGYFNPADFFIRIDDPLLETYNPSSNEMDIIYIAMPDPDPSSSYSVENVIATAAHEIAHAATFTLKTWNKIQGGVVNAAREELFLEEGWSHLTENLCGLGISGGNIRFLQHFLNNTSMYSFCRANHVGQQDSTGMRGAITLFLSWLFWQAGGMTWDHANPVDLIDLGGIAFLRRMAVSAETGWESIGRAFGQPTHVLFTQMLDEIHRSSMSNSSHVYTTDPLTNEAVDFFVNMGSFDSGTGTITIGFPASSSAFTPTTLLPWSFAFFETFNVPNTALLTINSTRSNSNVFFSYSMAE